MQSGQGSRPWPYCSQNAQPISAAQTRKPSRYARRRGGSSSSASEATPSAIDRDAVARLRQRRLGAEAAHEQLLRRAARARRSGRRRPRESGVADHAVAFSSAWSRSQRISSSDSRPTDRRIISGEHAGGALLVLGQLPVRRRRRMDDQRLRVADVGEMREELHGLDEALAGARRRPSRRTSGCRRRRAAGTCARAARMRLPGSSG